MNRLARRCPVFQGKGSKKEKTRRLVLEKIKRRTSSDPSAVYKK